MRFAINLVIGSEEDIQTWTNDPRNLRGVQQCACEKLLRVITRNRTLKEPLYFKRPNRWDQVSLFKFLN